MSHNLPVSVVVLNRDRVKEVARTLRALTHQTYPNFEVILVSNQLEKIPQPLLSKEGLKPVDMQVPNISKARNAGIEAASGEIIAFCDDDAVPEPEWLERLIPPLRDPKTGSVGGMVRGRNGISQQWGPQEVDCFGNDVALEPAALITTPTQKDRVLKTVGTNCAFSKEALVEVGGFDEALRFYLDETDLNWRLFQKGWTSALVGDAEVHHSYAASDFRTSMRAPKTLFEVGASKAYFCKQFADPARIPEELDWFRLDQRGRLIRAMELGILMPSQVSPMIDSLEEGFVTGATRTKRIQRIRQSGSDFIPYGRRKKGDGNTLIIANIKSRKRSHQEARELAAQGSFVTVFDFSYTTLMHTVGFTDGGYWLHKGGIWGRSNRESSLFQPNTFASRVEKELIRVAPQRKFDYVIDRT